MSKTTRAGTTTTGQPEPARATSRSEDALEMISSSVNGDRPSTNAADEVAREAYDLYCQGGYVDGRDVEHWIEAERRVNARRAASDSARAGGDVS